MLNKDMFRIGVKIIDAFWEKRYAPNTKDIIKCILKDSSMCTLADDDPVFTDFGIRRSDFYHFSRSLPPVEFDQFIDQVCENYDNLGGKMARI